LRYSVYIVSFVLFLIPRLIHGQENKYVLLLESPQEIPEEFQKNYHQLRGDSSFIINKVHHLLSDLNQSGYLTASIDTLQWNKDTIIAQLYPGKKYYYGTINYSEVDKTIAEKIKHPNQKGNELFHLAELLSLKEKILSAYENSGYPFVSLAFKPVYFEDSLIHLNLNVLKNNYYFIDSIIIKGDTKTSSHYLHRYIQLQPGDAYNQKRINETDKRINDLSFLSTIKPAEVEFKEKSADLYLYLKKQQANSLNGIIGFLPKNETTGGLMVTGQVNLSLINSFGRGENFFLQWEKLESSTQQLGLRYTHPYLFKTNMGIDGSFELYKQDSSYLSLQTGIGLQYIIDYQQSFRGYYRYKNSSRIGSNTAATDFNYADIKSNVFGLSFHYRQLDYQFNPRKGAVLDIFGGTGLKNINNFENTDSLNINPDNKLLEIDAGIDLKIYFPIYKNFIFHFSNTTRYLNHIADSEKEAFFFENELYRFGGTGSLRGFDENNFSASAYSLQNIEIRYLFEQNSAFYVFWNGAYYYKNVTRQVTEDFPWGIGIGASFETKAGIFTINYAVGKQFDNPMELRSAKIHFGYISRF